MPGPRICIFMGRPVGSHAHLSLRLLSPSGFHKIVAVVRYHFSLEARPARSKLATPCKDREPGITCIRAVPCSLGAQVERNSSSRPSLFLQPYHIKPLPVTPAAAAPATSSHCSHEAPSCLWAFALFLPRILLLRLLSQLTMSYPPYWIMRSLGSESKHGPIYLPSTYQATGPW